jgi:hypothetical protein
VAEWTENVRLNERNTHPPRRRPPPLAALAEGRAGRTCGAARCGEGNPAPGAEHGLGAGEVVGRRARDHGGVVQDEVVAVHERALKPQAGAGRLAQASAKMRPAHPTGPDRCDDERRAVDRDGAGAFGGNNNQTWLLTHARQVSRAMKQTRQLLLRTDWGDVLTILVASLGAGGFYLLKAFT